MRPSELRPAAAHVLGIAIVDDNKVIITADNKNLFLALILLHLNYKYNYNHICESSFIKEYTSVVSFISLNRQKR